MYRVSSSYPGVIHVGKETFKAGDTIPAETAKNMDIKSMTSDGTIEDGGKQGSGDDNQLKNLKKDELESMAKEMGIEVPEKATKEVLLKLIEEAQKE